MEHESHSAKQPVTSRPQLSEDEVTWAFVIGGGMLLSMLALGLNAIQGPGNSNALSVILPIGGLLMIGGIIGWLAQFRPWRKYDDLSTPLYSGHEGHETHEEHTDHKEQQEQQIEPPIPPPVISDPIEAFAPEQAQSDAPKPRKPRAKKTKAD